MHLTRSVSYSNSYDAVIAQLLGREHPNTSTLATNEVTIEQQKAIMAAQKGYSVFVHLPTGAGKSLTYQAPAFMEPQAKVTLVVSPLIALISDQVSRLHQRGISVTQRIGQQSIRQFQDRRMEEKAQLIYTTPEYLLLNAEMMKYVQHIIDLELLSRVVVDEAHCVFEWGSRFRPSYLELGKWKRMRCPHIPMSFATATISDAGIEQLAQLFDLEILKTDSATLKRSEENRHRQLVVVQETSDRSNLKLVIAEKSRDPKTNAAYIAHVCRNEPTIIYCLTRDESEQVALQLIRLGAQAGVYHAGMPPRKREFVRKQWMTSQLSIICATSAFGLGIDRADVRHVIHYTLPLSLSAYYQQIGRAGRDGAPSTCVVLYDPNDRSRASRIENAGMNETMEPAFRSQNSEGSSLALDNLIAFCETSACRRRVLFAQFGYSFDASACCRNCECGGLESLPICSSQIVSLPIDCNPTAKNKRVQQKYGRGSTISHADPSVEYGYQLIRQVAKYAALPKRKVLSRKVIAEILANKPQTVEELSIIKGVGMEKAQLYISTILKLFRNT